MIPGSGPESVYDSGSFRDPNSRVWREGSRVLRGLNDAAATDFAALTVTSFYRGACKAGDLVSSEPVEAAVPEGSDWALVLEHGPIDVITYAHEWSFSMLQDAASLTLKLVRAAIDEDMTSKDATPYNVQFVGRSRRSSTSVRSRPTGRANRGGVPAVLSDVSVSVDVHRLQGPPTPALDAGCG